MIRLGWSINDSLLTRSDRYYTTVHSLSTLWPSTSVWIHHAHLKPWITFRTGRILCNNRAVDSLKGFRPTLQRCISPLF